MLIQQKQLTLNSSTPRFLWVNGLVAIVMLVVIAFASVLVWPLPDEGFWIDDLTEAIAYVEPGGAADRAGLHQGDRVIQLYGHPVKEVLNSFYLDLLNSVRDQPLPIEVERGGTLLNIQFMAGKPPPSLQIYKASFALLAFLCWLAGYWLGIVRRHESWGSRLAAIFWLSMGGWLGTASFAQFVAPPIFFVVLLGIMIVVLVPLGIYIHLWFPERALPVNITRGVGVHLVTISVLVTCAFIALILITNFPVARIRDTMFLVLPFAVIAGVGCSGLILRRAYHNVTDSRIRRQIRLIVAAYLSVALLWTLLWGIPRVVTGERLINGSLLALLTAVIPLAYLSAGLPYDLYRLDRVVMRFLVHLITTTTLVTVLTLITHVTTVQWATASIWIAVAFVALYRPIQHGLMQVLPSTFRRVEQLSLDATIKALLETRDAAELVAILKAGIQAEFAEPPLAVFLGDIEGRSSLTLNAQEHIAGLPRTLASGTLTERLRCGPSIIERRTLQEELRCACLAEDEQLLLTHLSIVLWCPIRHSRGHLLGLLVLGMRGDFDPYRDSDHRRLLQINAAASLALSHSAAYAEIEQQVQARTAELQDANRQLTAYAAQAEELATIQERNRLAREIHDSLGHYFTAINMQIAAAKAVLDANRPRALAALDKAQHLTDDGLAEVRRSVAALRESSLGNRSLKEAIESLTETYRATGVHITFEVHGKPRSLMPSVTLALYRTAQEGLTNVRRHAHAACADVQLDYRDPSLIRLVICDDGRGAVNAEGGYGLVGVRERVQFLGGTVTIRTAPGHGFALEVEVPG